MAKIVRFPGLVKAFGINATGTNRTVFDDAAQSDLLSLNANTAWFLGWENVGPSDLPTIQDFQAMGFTLGQFIAYLHGMGVPEYDSAQEFSIDSVTNRNGILYVSIINSNINNDPAIDDGTKWQRVDPAPYLVDSGVLNAIIVTPSPAVTAYKTGQQLLIKIVANNTGSTTINVNGIGLKNAKKKNGVNLVAGDLLINHTYLFVYNGTDFIIPFPEVPAASVTTQGKIEIATNAEALSASSNVLAMVPASSKLLIDQEVPAATTAIIGKSRFATLSEVLAADGNNRAVNSSKALSFINQELQKRLETATGTATALVLTPSPAIASYQKGQTFYVKIATTNTGAATININGEGAKALEKNDGDPLVAFDIVAGRIYKIIYDGTQFIVTNPEVPNVESQTAANVAALEFKLDPTFRTNEFDFYTVRPITDNTRLFIRVSIDGGSTFKSGATDYTFVSTGINITGSFEDKVADDTTIRANPSALSAGVGQASGENGLDGRVKVFNPGSTSQTTQIQWDFSYVNADNEQTRISGSGHYQGSIDDITDIQFSFSSGNINTGRITRSSML